MRTTVLLLVLAACERAESSTPQSTSVPEPAPAVAPAPKPVVPTPAPIPIDRPVVHTHPPTKLPNLPQPPTDEPKAYATWFAALPKADRTRIDAACKKLPRTYDWACGGIGALHIPYPPYMRAHVPGPNLPASWFDDAEVWQASLTRTQRRYIDRMCPGGEDQPTSDLCGDNTPLVVAFADQPVTFARGTMFAFGATPVATAWPTAATPWTALDRDGNGTIDHGAELFGSATPLPDGTTARNGFTALAVLDANHDGRIDAADPGFGSLVLWADRDADGRSTTGELRPLADTVVAISLASQLDPRCDARDNCEGERAALTWRDATGALHAGTAIDVYLPRR